MQRRARAGLSGDWYSGRSLKIVQIIQQIKAYNNLRGNFYYEYDRQSIQFSLCISIQYWPSLLPLQSYMEQNNIRELYLTERVKNFAYNFRYRAIAFFEEYTLEEVLSAYQTAYLLGREFSCNPANVNEVNARLAQTFKDIIWITYRTGFPELLKDCGYDSSFVTDTGWGCMIRVGQMLFAEILKNYLKPNSKEEFTMICDEFNDFSDESIFSIQRIARRGNKQFNLAPGAWYNPAQIAYILSDFMNESKDKRLRNLKTIVFNNSSLFFDQIKGSFELQQKQECNHLEENMENHLICQICCASEKKLAIIILVRLGLDTAEPHYLTILDQMMALKYFRGIIGGKPKKALYFVGRKDDEYVYLDPHYVQTANKDITQNKNSYFCESFRRCKNTAIDPSLGICFWLDSIAQFNGFYLSMSKIKEKYHDFFIYMADETPHYLKQENHQIEQEVEEASNESGAYQVL